MHPVAFREANKTLGPQRGQESSVMPLPVFSDGKQCISAWELTDADLKRITETRRIWLSVIAGPSQPPVWVDVLSPFDVHPTTAHEVCYECVDNGQLFWCWNTTRQAPPNPVMVDGLLYNISEKYKPRHVPQKKLTGGDYYLRDPRGEEGLKRADVLQQQMKETEFYRNAGAAASENILMRILENSLTAPVLCRLLKLTPGTEEILC